MAGFRAGVAVGAAGAGALAALVGALVWPHGVGDALTAPGPVPAPPPALPALPPGPATGAEPPAVAARSAEAPAAAGATDRPDAGPLADATPDEIAWLRERLAERRATAPGPRAAPDPDAPSLAVLAAARRGDVDPSPRLRDFAAFTRGLEAPRGGPVRTFTEPAQVTYPALHEALVAGHALEFGPGRFELPQVIGVPEGVDAITIRGAGMDATTLVGGFMKWSGAPVHRFVIEDCTLEGALAVNTNVEAGILWRRVRATGFSEAVRFNAPGVFAAERCEFLGGTGGFPGGHGAYFRAPALAYFRECLVADCDGAFGYDHPKMTQGSQVVLEGCVLENALARSAWAGASEAADAVPYRLRGCEVRWGGPAAGATVASVHAVGLTDAGDSVLRAGVPRTTVATVRAVIGAVSERAFGVEFCGARETRRVALALEVEPGRTEVRRFVWDGTGLAPDRGPAWMPRYVRDGPVPAGLADVRAFLAARNVADTVPMQGCIPWSGGGAGAAATYYRTGYAADTEFYPVSPPTGG